MKHLLNYKIKTLAAALSLVAAIALTGCGDDSQNQGNGGAVVPVTSTTGGAIVPGIGQSSYTPYGTPCNYVNSSMCLPGYNNFPQQNFCSNGITYNGFYACQCTTGNCTNSFSYNNLSYYYVTPYTLWPQYYNNASLYSNYRLVYYGGMFYWSYNNNNNWTYWNWNMNSGYYQYRWNGYTWVIYRRM